jgi:hypothetical protein
MCYIVKNDYLSIDIKVKSMNWLKNNAIGIIGIALAFIASWYAVDRRLAILEERDAMRQREIVTMQGKMETFVGRGEMSEVKTALQNVNDKLDRLIERNGGK